MSSLLEMLIPTGGRKARRLLSEGQVAQARVTGIRVRTRSERADRWEYGLEVPGDVPFRAGCRQSLSPEARARVRLGALVPVRFRDRDVIIDEPAWGDEDGSDAARTGNVGWKSLSTPPPDGIEDQRLERERKRMRNGTPATATVESATSRESAMGLAERWDIVMTVDPERVHRVQALGSWVPEYARHLLVAGAALPVFVDRSRAESAMVDWEAAGATGGSLQASTYPGP